MVDSQSRVGETYRSLDRAFPLKQVLLKRLNRQTLWQGQNDLFVEHSSTHLDRIIREIFQFLAQAMVSTPMQDAGVSRHLLDSSD